MKNRGFSLVELLVVIGLIGIISAIATMNFNSWQIKTQIESQTRTLFASLNQARIDAMQHKLPRSIVLSPNMYTYRQYSSENEDRAAGTIVQTQPVANTLTEISGPADNITYFDVRGYTDDTGTIQLYPAGTSAAVDCVFVSTGRTNIGKMANGTCTIN
jgi:prepilin-type N-terminal cleavage/methylation domain-containing protein